MASPDTPQSDDELVATGRRQVPASSPGVVTGSRARGLASEARTQTADLVEQATGTRPDVYDDPVATELAEHLFVLRLDERARQHPRDDSRADRPIPESFARLRRHDFADTQLAFHRDEVVRLYNELTQE